MHQVGTGAMSSLRPAARTRIITSRHGLCIAPETQALSLTSKQSLGSTRSGRRVSAPVSRRTVTHEIQRLVERLLEVGAGRFQFGEVMPDPHELPGQLVLLLPSDVVEDAACHPPPSQPRPGAEGPTAADLSYLGGQAHH